MVDEPVKQDGGGLRSDEGKPRYDLIPPEFMDALAIHYAQGSKKYSERNWERGMPWSKCFGPLMRHAWAWMRGETFDADPKLPDYHAHHMVAVAWNAIALYVYDVRKAGNDDRPASVAIRNDVDIMLEMKAPKCMVCFDTTKLIRRFMGSEDEVQCPACGGTGVKL